MVRILVVIALALTLGLAGCGGDDEESSSTTTATTESTSTETTAVGDATAGKAVFLSTGCGSCHTLQAAGATGTIGPDLDERLASDAQEDGEPLAEYIRTSIVDPDADVTPGFQAGVMSSGYGDQLSDEQLDDLVAFLVQSVQ